MSHYLPGWGITGLGEATYSIWVGSGLPKWSRSFTHENDGGEAV
jgi:hypothetical protein